jgi:hypothetical protein
MSDITNYNQQLELIKVSCLNINNESEIKDLFKGVLIMFMKDIIQLYNKLLKKLPELKCSNSSEKISNLNTLLESLEGDGKLFNIDCNEIILKGYVSYIYTIYRDGMMEWDLEAIKRMNKNNITEAVIDTATAENVKGEASEYLNIIPELVLMINNLKEKDILKVLYLLNNLNVIIDVYLVKKSQKIF